MKLRPPSEVERHRIKSGLYGSTPEYGNNGAFLIPHDGLNFSVLVSDGGGWDHVSVSLPDRCPTWEEMDHFKRMFWDDSEAVMQLHPPRSQWVSHHRYCLHMWKPQEGAIPLPPSVFVGPQSNASKPIFEPM